MNVNFLTSAELVKVPVFIQLLSVRLLVRLLSCHPMQLLKHYSFFTPHVVLAMFDTYQGCVPAVAIRSTGEAAFLGFQIRVQRVMGDREELVGEFVSGPKETTAQRWYPADVNRPVSQSAHAYDVSSMTSRLRSLPRTRRAKIVHARVYTPAYARARTCAYKLMSISTRTR